MNPIISTAIKLEQQAQALYNALQKHPSLYARNRLTETAWERYQRRVSLTDTIRQLEQPHSNTKRLPVAYEVPCPTCDGEGGWDDSFYWEMGDAHGVHGGPTTCEACGGSGWIDLKDPGPDALDDWLFVPVLAGAPEIKEAA